MEHNHKMSEELKNRFKDRWTYVLIYVFFFIIALMAPPGGDDFAQAMWYKKSIPSLIDFFMAWDGYYGRVSSFFADAFLGYFRPMWYLLSPLVYVLILDCIYKIINCNASGRTNIVYLIMLLCFSKAARAETQFWLIGNVNYFFCICIMCIYIYCFVSDLRKKTVCFFETEKLDMVIYFVYGFMGALWIENLSIAFSSLVVLLGVFAWTKKNKVSKRVLAGNIGVVLGTVFLLTSGSLRVRVNTNTSLFQQIEVNLPVVMYHLVGSCLLLYMIFSCIILLAVGKKKLTFSFIFMKYMYIVANVSVILIGAAYYIGKDLGGYFSDFLLFKNIYYMMEKRIYGLGFVLEVVILIILFVTAFKAEISEILLPLYISAAASVAPMVLDPSARTLVYAQCIVIVIALYWFCKIEFNKKDEEKILNIVLGILLVIRLDIYFFYLLPAYEITQIREKRISEIQEMSYTEDKNIILKLPVYDDNFVVTLNSLYYAESIKDEYKLDSNVKIIFEDGFNISELDIGYLEELDLFEVELVQCSEEEYNYRFVLYHDGVAVDIIETEKLDKVYFKDVYGIGSYRAECTVVHEASGMVKTSFSNTIYR